jgi:hypothetical protein
MKESHRKGVASHPDPESCVGSRKAADEALTGAHAGWVLSCEIIATGVLRRYLPGWKEYFQLAETPRVFADYDKWIRQRLPALQLKQWKRGSKIYAEMRRLGLSAAVAAQAAAVRKRWWSRAARLVHAGLTVRYYDPMGVPRLAD